MLTHQLSSLHQTAPSYPSSSVPWTQCFDFYIAKHTLLLLRGALTLQLGQNITLLACLYIRSLLQLNCTFPIALCYLVAKFNEKSLCWGTGLNHHPYCYASVLSFLCQQAPPNLNLSCSCLLGWPPHLLCWVLWILREVDTWEHGALPQLLALKHSKSRFPSALPSALLLGRNTAFALL